jgi:hypothetical protein
MFANSKFRGAATLVLEKLKIRRRTSTLFKRLLRELFNIPENAPCGSVFSNSYDFTEEEHDRVKTYLRVATNSHHTDLFDKYQLRFGAERVVREYKEGTYESTMHRLHTELLEGIIHDLSKIGD